MRSIQRKTGNYMSCLRTRPCTGGKWLTTFVAASITGRLARLHARLSKICVDLRESPQENDHLRSGASHHTGPSGKVVVIRPRTEAALECWVQECPKGKADSTLRSSQAVPHPSTNRALRRLTSEVGRDPVHSTRYGRQRVICL